MVFESNFRLRDIQKIAAAGRCSPRQKSIRRNNETPASERSATVSLAGVFEWSQSPRGESIDPGAIDWHWQIVDLGEFNNPKRNAGYNGRRAFSNNPALSNGLSLIRLL
jgi:hypothetical protein